MTTIGNVNDMQSILYINRQESLNVSTQEETINSNVVTDENGMTTVLIEDTVEISAEGRELSRKSKEEEQGKTVGQKIYEETLATKEAFKEAEIRTKCAEIAMKLAAGEKIPVEDHKYLQKNEPEMYAQAMKVRIPKNESEEAEKRISKEDGQKESVRELFQPTQDMFRRNINSTHTMQIETE